MSNNGGIHDYGIGLLLKNNQVKKMHASFVGENENIGRLYMEGKLEIEFTP